MATLRLRRAHHEVWFERRPLRGGRFNWAIEQNMLYNMIRILRLSLGQEWWPEHIQLMRRESLERETSEWLQNSQVDLSCPATAVRFPPEALRAPAADLPSSGSPALPMKSAPNTTSEALAECLRPYLAGEQSRMVEFCRIFGVTPRSLQRWLKAERTHYQAVLDQARHAVVLELLDSREFSITVIGRNVGYSNPSAFSRAFRRWTGYTPRDSLRLKS